MATGNRFMLRLTCDAHKNIKRKTIYFYLFILREKSIEWIYVAGCHYSLHDGQPTAVAHVIIINIFTRTIVYIVHQHMCGPFWSVPFVLRWGLNECFLESTSVCLRAECLHVCGVRAGISCRVVQPQSTISLNKNGEQLRRTSGIHYV